MAENLRICSAAAGWNILVGTGVALGINLDKPQRARKVGNEYVPRINIKTIVITNIMHQIVILLPPSRPSPRGR